MDKSKQKKGELEYFYNKKKWLIEITAFFGLSSALFLQIDYLGYDSLRMLQATLLIIFSCLMSFLLLNFWIYLIENKPETRSRIVVNGLILSAFIFGLIFYLFKFLYDAFIDELFFYLGWIRIGVSLLVIIYLEKIAEFFTKNFGKEKLWTVLVEFIWILIIVSFWIFPKNYLNIWPVDFQIIIGINLALLFVINLLHAYQKINIKMLYIFITVIIAISILSYFLIR